MVRFCVITIYHISVPRWLSIVESCDMFFSMPFSCFLIWQAVCHGSIGLFFQEKIDQYTTPDVGHETRGLEDEPWTMVGQALAAHVWLTVSKLAWFLLFATAGCWQHLQTSRNHVGDTDFNLHAWQDLHSRLYRAGGNFHPGTEISRLMMVQKSVGLRVTTLTKSEILAVFGGIFSLSRNSAQ